ncbi:MAG TPA: TetR/AcrR family transcriptional regulator [Gemmatimonadales bacterium]|nr:TetR/AcrR family transcriptional regulator [Gemmatimonadales bacterium]
MDMREQLLKAAVRVYAEFGYHGTTTRRIAEAAGVNEVTLFRHFGTKEALIKAALQEAGRLGRPEPLPEPTDPATELHAFARSCFEQFYRHRNLIRRVMGDLVENPGIAPAICAEPGDVHCQLAGYFARLKERGMARGDVPPEAAAGILIGAILSHALWRDHLPQEPPPPETVLRHYVDLVLAAVMATPPAQLPATR